MGNKVAYISALRNCKRKNNFARTFSNWKVQKWSVQTTHLRNHTRHALETINSKLEITNIWVDVNSAGSLTTEKEQKTWKPYNPVQKLPSLNNLTVCPSNEFLNFDIYF